MKSPHAYASIMVLAFRESRMQTSPKTMTPASLPSVHSREGDSMSLEPSLQDSGIALWSMSMNVMKTSSFSHSPSSKQSKVPGWTLGRSTFKFSRTEVKAARHPDGKSPAVVTCLEDVNCVRGLLFGRGKTMQRPTVPSYVVWGPTGCTSI